MNNSIAATKIRFLNTLATLFGWISSDPCHLRILTFHNIGDDNSIHTLKQQQFADFLSVVVDSGYHTIRANDIVKLWPQILKKERNVLLTFDDGYASHRDIVSSLLSHLNMTATFFVLSSFVDKQRTCAEFSGHLNTFMSTKDIREMNGAGFEIGSHTHTHPLCGLITDNEFRQEISVSKKILEDAAETSITSFSYPYGRQRAYTTFDCIALAETGYTAAFTQSGKKITPKTNLFSLPRINIDRFDTLQTFQRKLLGNYELVFQLRNYGN